MLSVRGQGMGERELYLCGWVVYPFRTKGNINIATKCMQSKCGKAARARKVKEEKNRNSRKRINSLVFSLFVLLLIATTDITQKRSLVKKKQKKKYSCQWFPQ